MMKGYMMKNLTDNKTQAAASKLTKLLAAENISVRYSRGVKAAEFDPVKRFLTLPLWKDSVSSELIDCLVGHEVAHALWTPSNTKTFVEALQTETGAPKNVVEYALGVAEDVRVNKKMSAKFPGLVRDFTIGYKDRFDKNHFQTNGKNVTEMSIIDRINLENKVGTFVDTNLSDPEKSLFLALQNASNFDEVVALTKSLIEMAAQENKQPEQTPPMMPQAGETGEEEESENTSDQNGENQNQQSQNSKDSKNSEKKNENSVPDGDKLKKEQEKKENSDSGENGDSEKDSSNGQNGDQKSDKSDGESPGDGQNGDQDGDSDGDSQDGDQSGNGNGDSDQQGDGQNGDGDNQDRDDQGNNNENGQNSNQKSSNSGHAKLGQHGGMPDWSGIGQTAKAENSSFGDMISDSGSRKVDNFGLMKFKLEAIVDFKTLLPARQAPTDSDYEKWKAFMKTEKQIVDYMVKEFEQKKAADRYARISLAPTGRLNMNRISQYQIRDDIFLRNEVVPEGKNHGFVVFIDGSGSMSNIIEDCRKQALIMSMLFKRLAIPYEIYSFHSGSGFRVKVFDSTPDSEVVGNNFKIVNILSSRMTIKEYNLAAAQLLSGKTSSAFEGLTATPLCSTVMAATTIVQDFIDKYRIQKMNTVFITDGGASDDSHISFTGKNKTFMHDFDTKMSFEFDKSKVSNLTSALVTVLKEKTGTKVFEFYLARRENNDRIFRLASNLFDVLPIKSKKDEMLETGFIALKSKVYDEVYFVDPSILKISNIKETGNVDEDFANKMKNLKSNRLFSANFIKQIS